MHYSCALLLIGGGLLGAPSGATAQSTSSFSLGPRIGYTLATTNYQEVNPTTSLTSGYRSGLEAGVVATIRLGRVGLQPAVLYTQKGFTLDRADGQTTGVTLFRNSIKYRFDYLTVPLNFSLSLKSTGEGLQVFAGPYVGFLLGGRYTYSAQFYSGSGSSVTRDGAGEVKPGDTAEAVTTSTDYYSRRFDAGAQAGLGYRYHNLLIQATYSLGLRNMGVDITGFTNPPTYHNRAFQASVAYLFDL